MSEIIVQNGAKLEQKQEIAKLYYATFEQKLTALLGANHAISLIEQNLNLDRVIVALKDDDIMGFAGLSYHGRGFFDPDRAAMRREYGLLGGTFRAVIGDMISTKPRKNQLLLEGIGVSPMARGQGIGSQLLTAVHEHARSIGKNEVILEVVDTNPKAKALYERVGYETIKTSKTGFLREAGFTAVDLMRLKLT